MTRAERAAQVAAISEQRKQRLRAMVEHYQSQDIEIDSVHKFTLLAAATIGGSSSLHRRFLIEMNLEPKLERLTKAARRERRIRAYLESTEEVFTMADMLRETIPDITIHSGMSFLNNRPSLIALVKAKIEELDPSGQEGDPEIVEISDRDFLLSQLDKSKASLLIKLDRWYGGVCTLDRVFVNAGFGVSSEGRGLRDYRRKVGLEWVEAQPEIFAEKFESGVMGSDLGYRVCLAQPQHKGVA
ncbi:MAG: hypothetical protein AAFV72_00050 [Cyanobacteria bacterium J06635_1]